MNQRAVWLVALTLLLSGCTVADPAGGEVSSTTTAATTSSLAPAVTTTTVESTTTTTVAPTATTVAIVAEWMAAFPSFGIPGDALEICGVVRGPSLMNVVVSDPTNADTWTVTTGDRVRPFENGQWCWEGEFPAEMQDQAGARYPITPGNYDITLEYEGRQILQTSLEVSSEELVAALPPSQSAADAARDGVVPEVAALPFFRRAKVETEVESAAGVWMLTTMSRAVEEESWASGCGLGDPTGVYPIDIICTVEYGEILLAVDGAIAKAYPMPGAIPSWLYLTDEHVYGGRIGDGGLPDSTLVKIDRATLEALVVVIPSEIDGGTEWLPDWYVAPDGYRDRYYEAVHVNSDEPGTPVLSWIADFTVDLAAIDEIIAEVVDR